MSRVFTVEFKYRSNFYTGLITELTSPKGDLTYRVSLFDEDLRSYFPMGSIILRTVRGEDNMQSRSPENAELSESLTAAIRNYTRQHPVTAL